MKLPHMLPGVVDNPQSKVIRFRRGEHGRQKYFSYAKRPIEEAIAEANAYAAEYTNKHGPPRPVSYKGVMTSRNHSGKPGVFHIKRYFKKWDRYYWYWGCSWPGAAYAKKFSLIDYGDETAFVLAYIACELETMDTETALAAYTQYEINGRIPEILKLKKQDLPLF